MIINPLQIQDKLFSTVYSDYIPNKILSGYSDFYNHRKLRTIININDELQFYSLKTPQINFFLFTILSSASFKTIKSPDLEYKIDIISKNEYNTENLYETLIILNGFTGIQDVTINKTVVIPSIDVLKEMYTYKIRGIIGNFYYPSDSISINNDTSNFSNQQADNYDVPVVNITINQDDFDLVYKDAFNKYELTVSSSISSETSLENAVKNIFYSYLTA